MAMHSCNAQMLGSYLTAPLHSIPEPTNFCLAQQTLIRAKNKVFYMTVFIFYFFNICQYNPCYLQLSLRDMKVKEHNQPFA